MLPLPRLNRPYLTVVRHSLSCACLAKFLASGVSDVVGSGAGRLSTKSCKNYISKPRLTFSHFGSLPVHEPPKGSALRC